MELAFEKCIPARDRAEFLETFMVFFRHQEGEITTPEMLHLAPSLDLEGAIADFSRHPQASKDDFVRETIFILRMIHKYVSRPMRTLYIFSDSQARRVAKIHSLELTSSDSDEKCVFGNLESFKKVLSNKLVKK